MRVSSVEVKQFLFEVVSKSAFPGSLSEFVSAVKREIAAAEVGELAPEPGHKED